MKYAIFSFIFLIFISCKDTKQEEASNDNETTEVSNQDNDTSENQSFFGEEFDYAQAETAAIALEKYQDLKPGDTITTSFTASVNSVCVKKGCWMRLKLDDDKESFVRFKDYGFFVPKDIKGQEATVHGKLFVNETSVEDLKHYAMDAGKSEEEIAAITEPKVEYSFLADGVHLDE